MYMHALTGIHSRLLMLLFVVLRCGLMLRDYQWIMQMRKLSKKSNRKIFCPCFIRLDACITSNIDFYEAHLVNRHLVDSLKNLKSLS